MSIMFPFIRTGVPPLWQIFICFGACVGCTNASQLTDSAPSCKTSVPFKYVQCTLTILTQTSGRYANRNECIDPKAASEIRLKFNWNLFKFLAYSFWSCVFHSHFLSRLLPLPFHFSICSHIFGQKSNHQLRWHVITALLSIIVIILQRPNHNFILFLVE